MAALTWTYERDECWGAAGEPLLSATLRNDQLLLRLRNSRQYGLEAVIATVGSHRFDGESAGPAFKVAFDDGGLQPLQARVQSEGETAFVTDIKTLVAELNCSNRLRLHARPQRGGVWWQLDATMDDLLLDRLVEPACGILLSVRKPERPRPAAVPAPERPAQPAQPAHPARRARPAQQAATAEASATAELIGAVAPLAAFALGAKLGQKMFGPDKRG